MGTASKTSHKTIIPAQFKRKCSAPARFYPSLTPQYQSPPQGHPTTT